MAYYPSNILLPVAPVKKEPEWDTDMCDVSEATRAGSSNGHQLKNKPVQSPSVPSGKQLEMSSDGNHKRSARRLTNFEDTRVKKEVVDPKEVFEVNNELVLQPAVVSPLAKRRKLSRYTHLNQSVQELKKDKISDIKCDPDLKNSKVTSEGQTRDEVNSWLLRQAIKSGNLNERSKCESVEAELGALYAGHELKDEVVVGPLTLQHPDVVYAMMDTQRSNSSPAARKICSVKLEQMCVNTELSECRVGRNTYKIRPSGLAGQSIRDKIAKLFDSDDSSPEAGASSGDDDNYSCEEEFDDPERQLPIHNPIPHSKRRKRRPYPPYKCELCDKVYRKKYIFLKRHIKDTHMTNGVFKCNVCGHETGKLKNYRMHLMRHTGEKPYKCSLCSYASIRKSNLERHERDHAGVKRFECNECDFKTQYSISIYSHLLVHTDEKPFKCDQCDYVAKSMRYLQRHKPSHVGLKRFKCECCSYSSSWKTQLRKHQETHRNEEKPYRCSQCDYRGAKKQHLKRHLDRHNAPKK